MAIGCVSNISNDDGDDMKDGEHENWLSCVRIRTMMMVIMMVMLVGEGDGDGDGRDDDDDDQRRVFSVLSARVPFCPL